MGSAGTRDAQRIAVLFPTRTEADGFADGSVLTSVCGVGSTATAYATARTIAVHDPDLLILAGVAGAFPGSGLEIGDVVLVASEVEADLGIVTAGGFTPLSVADVAMDFERPGEITCPFVPPTGRFRAVRGATVHTAMSPFVDGTTYDVETMEGAAFFYVARRERRRFLQLRAISNVVGSDDPWQVDTAVAAMSRGLRDLLAEVRGH